MIVPDREPGRRLLRLLRPVVGWLDGGDRSRCKSREATDNRRGRQELPRLGTGRGEGTDGPSGRLHTDPPAASINSRASAKAAVILSQLAVISDAIGWKGRSSPVWSAGSYRPCAAAFQPVRCRAQRHEQRWRRWIGPVEASPRASYARPPSFAASGSPSTRLAHALKSAPCRRSSPCTSVTGISRGVLPARAARAAQTPAAWPVAMAIGITR
jgi:hypothetical protein